jgi:two-component system chemotaxis response regulator CheY
LRRGHRQQHCCSIAEWAVTGKVATVWQTPYRKGLERFDAATTSPLPVMSRLSPRLLVVDDDEQIRRVARRLLTRAGFTEIDEAQNGAVALKMLREVLYDLVITGWEMPQLGGSGLMKALREWPERRHIPLLVLSGAFVNQALAEGADIVLGKPFGTSEFIDGVRLLLARGISKE